MASEARAQAKLSTGREVDVPFECRRAEALLLAGTVALPAAQAWLAGEPAHPIALTEERAPAIVWCMNYLDTVVGQYTEIVATVLVRDEPAPPVSCEGPWELCALALDPSVRGFIHRLLLPASAPDAIAYGRELLRLDKAACDRIDFGRDPFVAVRTVDAYASGHAALRVRVGLDDTFKTRRQAGWGMLRAAGLRALLALRGQRLTGQAPKRMGGGLIDCQTRGPVTLQPWAKGDECLFTDATPLTAELKAAHFVPRAVQRSDALAFTMSLRAGT